MRIGVMVFVVAFILSISTVMVAVAHISRPPDPKGDPYPSAQQCRGLVADLPRTTGVPILVLVSAERGGPLPAAAWERVLPELKAGASRFPFVKVTFALAGTADPPSDVHVLPLQVWTSQPLYPGQDEGKPSHAEGMMCGNMLLIEDRNMTGYEAWGFTHEFAHFLGLPHSDGTLMNGHGFRSHRFDHFDACQLAVLNSWRGSGAYVPQWDRLHRGARVDNAVSLAIDEVLYHAYGW
jgi:hypothetical protein